MKIFYDYIILTMFTFLLKNLAVKFKRCFFATI